MDRAKGHPSSANSIKPLYTTRSGNIQTASTSIQPELPPVLQSPKPRSSPPNALNRMSGVQPKVSAIPSPNPPVYRPQIQPKQLQGKTGAPPVYRPTPPHLQSAIKPPDFGRTLSVAQHASQSTAPPVYKPTQSPMAPPARPILAHEAKQTAQQRPATFTSGAAQRKPLFQNAAIKNTNQLQNNGRFIRDSFPVVQRMRKNITLVSEEDRYFETPDQEQRIRVNPENDPYLEDYFNELTRVSRTTASLAQKIVFIVRKYKLVPYEKQKKIEALESWHQTIETSSGTKRQEVRNLGYMFYAKAVTCWEKAALCHLSLAEIGIGSVLEGGYNKTTGTGHAWLLLDVGCIIDPTKGTILARSDYEAKYDITVPPKRVASPKVSVGRKEQRAALKQAAAILNSIKSGTLDDELTLEFKELLKKVKVIKQQDEGRAKFEREQFMRYGPWIQTPEGHIKRRNTLLPFEIKKYKGRHMDDWDLYQPGGPFEL